MNDSNFKNIWKIIRKFGPEYSDLPTMIWNINILLRVLTVNIDSRTSTPIPLVIYFLTTFCAICYTYGYLLSTVWFVFWYCKQTKNLVAAMVVLSLCVSSSTSTMKLFHLILHASEMRDLIGQCLEFDAFSETNTRFMKNITENLKIVKLRAIMFWSCIIVIAVTYNIIPAFLTGRHLPEDLLVFYGLEPQFETPNFQISYAIMAISVFFICYTASTLTCFNIIIVGYIEAQMTSLSEEILCLWEDSVQDITEFKIEHLYTSSENKSSTFDDDARVKINSGVRRRLIDILQKHARNITISRSIDEFYDIPNAIAFGCLGVSLIAELLGGLQNTYLQVPYTLVLVVMDCLSGQRIMDASEAFETAIYSCRWEDFDNDNMKIVLLMLQNSQRTMTISAGRMAVLNFPCLMSIGRTVYSTYTTLRSMISS